MSEKTSTSTPFVVQPQHIGYMLMVIFWAGFALLCVGDIFAAVMIVLGMIFASVRYNAERDHILDEIHKTFASERKAYLANPEHYYTTPVDLWNANRNMSPLVISHNMFYWIGILSSIGVIIHIVYWWIAPVLLVQPTLGLVGTLVTLIPTFIKCGMIHFKRPERRDKLFVNMDKIFLHIEAVMESDEMNNDNTSDDDQGINYKPFTTKRISK